jgi:hypothetical protein
MAKTSKTPTLAAKKTVKKSKAVIVPEQKAGAEKTAV